MSKVKKPIKVDSSLAEKWLTDNQFVYQGNVYLIQSNLKIKKVIKNG